MEQKLLEILKKAKSVDERAKQFDSMDSSTLQERVESRQTNVGTQQTPTTNVTPNNTTNVKKPVNVNSGEYKQKVKESKLPPEIQKLMLDNPIQQPDPVGTSGLGLDEETIRQINPNYNTQNNVITEQVTQNSETTSYDRDEIRKIMAEEMSKVLPKIIGDYFNNEIIKENTRLMKVLLKESKNRNNTK